MLNPHRALRILKLTPELTNKQWAVFQVREVDDDGFGRCSLEAEGAVPRHVLDGEEGAVGDDDHVEVGVGDEDSVGCFDDAREDGLDGVEGDVAAAFGAAFTDEDCAVAAFGPFNVLLWVLSDNYSFGIFEERSLLRAVNIPVRALPSSHHRG